MRTDTKTVTKIFCQRPVKPNLQIRAPNSNNLIFYSERDGEVGKVDLSTAFKTFLKNIDHEGRAEGLRTSSDGKARTHGSLGYGCKTR